MTRLLPLVAFGLLACSHDPQPKAATETASARSVPADAQLRGMLAPIDSPLPTLEQLEAIQPDAADLLTEIARDPEAPEMVRGNALRVLGQADADAVLIGFAADSEQSTALRVAALEGFAGRSDAEILRHRDLLVELLASPEAPLAVAAGRVALGVPELRSVVRAAVEADGMHPAAVRILKRGLEEGR